MGRKLKFRHIKQKSNSESSLLVSISIKHAVYVSVAEYVKQNKFGGKFIVIM